MNNFKKQEKICGFYVSDMHFLTMLLPYINKNIKDGKSFYTFLEFNQEKNIKTLLQKIMGNEIEKEKINKIDWQYTPHIEYKNIEEKINNIKEGNIIIVAGSKEYINKVNNNLEMFFNKKQIDSIKIINCYDINVFNKNIKEILDNHTKIINTSGEREIEDIFTEYKKSAV